MTSTKFKRGRLHLINFFFPKKDVKYKSMLGNYFCLFLKIKKYFLNSKTHLITIYIFFLKKIFYLFFQIILKNNYINIEND